MRPKTNRGRERQTEVDKVEVPPICPLCPSASYIYCIIFYIRFLIHFTPSFCRFCLAFVFMFSLELCSNSILSFSTYYDTELATAYYIPFLCMV